MKLFPLIILFACSIANASSSCDQAINDQDLKNCASKEFLIVDRKLNEAYGRLHKLLDIDGQRKLKNSQRAWIKFRDLAADFSGDINRGGSAESLSIIGAKTTMTEDRVKDLEREIDGRK